MMNVQTLLHNLGPYLATDRFRALLKGQSLPKQQQGAAMFVDISGFTPLTLSLVKQFGPQRASEELKRRLNPMFEAIAGLVFTHGGSVLRFVGDGFTAWFPDELDHAKTLKTQLPGIVRASVAGIEMQEMMIFFQGLEVKVGVHHGTARRWVVGNPKMGLLDILAGTVAENVAQVTSRCNSKEVRAAASDHEILKHYSHLHYTPLSDGDLHLTKCSGLLIEQSRAHRWGAWQVEGSKAEDVLDKVKQFVDPLIQEQESAGLGSISSELRYATPIFLKFSGIDYNKDPQAHQKLDSYIQDVQNILSDTNGRLVSLEVADKGSVVFAVFGAPIAYGDDSRRAIYATLNFRDLKTIHPYIANQQIGASRGLLYSGTVGGEVRHEYTSLGDETNVASRMMSADKQGNILISQAVYDDTGGWFEFEAGEMISPKGRVGFIQTFIPKRAKHIVKQDQRKTALVGRDTELDTINKALEHVGFSNAKVLRLEGAAGIGKSRIAAELDYLSVQQQRVVAHGVCISTGSNTALLPWRMLIRSLMQLEHETPSQEDFALIQQWVKDRNATWLSRLPLLSDILEIPITDNDLTRNLTGNARQQALFTLIMDILYHEASTTPLTLIIEDTHWIDEVSEALLIELVNRMTVSPVAILLVLLHRLNTEVSHPAKLLNTLHKTHIHQYILLDELSQNAIGKLLESHMGGEIPSELTQFVYEKSLGNPFFALEITDALETSEIIQRIGSKVYLEQNLNTVNIPQNIQGLILSRIDQLAESEKMILKLAAVIGRQFEIRLLYQSLPIRLDGETLMKHLRDLEQKQFIYLESLYPEPNYSFRHSITQEVTYQTLLYDQRKRWHFSVADNLERLAPDDWERLAYHFSRSDDDMRAYVYLVRAGDRAAQEFANHAALEYWGQALRLTRSDKENFDILSNRLELLMRTADRATIEHDLDQLVELAQQSPENINWQLRKARYQAEYAITIGDWQQAQTYTNSAIDLARNYRDQQLNWDIHAIQAQIYSHIGDMKNRRATTRQMRQIAIELNEPPKWLRLAITDLLELSINSPTQALSKLKVFYPQISSQNAPLLEANYWTIVSEITLKNRILDQADSALNTQLQLWQQVGNRRMESSAQWHLGQIFYWMGQYIKAGAQLRKSYMTASQVNDMLNQANNLIYLGAIAFRRKAYGEAAAYIERGLNELIPLQSHSHISRAYYFLGQIAIQQEQFSDGRDYLLKALTTRKQISKHPQSLHELELALAYNNAHHATLPLPEEFSPAIDALIAKEFYWFHDVDLSLLQAYTLQQLFNMDHGGLKQAAQAYLTQMLNYCKHMKAEEDFLEMDTVKEIKHQFQLR